MSHFLSARARRVVLLVAAVALTPALTPLAAQGTRPAAHKGASSKSAAKKPSTKKAATKASSTQASPRRAASKKGAATRATAVAVRPASVARPDSALRAFQVDTVAEPIPETLAPRYPRELRSREVRGSVVAEFVVDTVGRVEPGTFRVISSDDPAFIASVRELLPQARFLPAINEGRLVRQTVRQTFVFDLDVLQRPGAGATPTTP